MCSPAPAGMQRCRCSTVPWHRPRHRYVPCMTAMQLTALADNCCSFRLLSLQQQTMYSAAIHVKLCFAECTTG